MVELLLDNDSTITSEEDILKELVRFYTTLFAHDEDLSNNQNEALQKLLHSTRQVLTTHDIKQLEKKLTKRELSRALQKMAKKKSLGIDGMTAEVYKACWDFIEDAFFNMILHFWETREIYPQFNEGVLKLDHPPKSRS